MSNTVFTLADVLKILRNVGMDITCGACMEVAFCNVTTAQHTCMTDLQQETYTRKEVAKMFDVPESAISKGAKIGRLSAQESNLRGAHESR